MQATYLDTAVSSSGELGVKLESLNGSQENLRFREARQLLLRLRKESRTT